MSNQEAAVFDDRQQVARSRWDALPRTRIVAIIKSALDEDIGRGDVTSLLTVGSQRAATARFMVQSPGVVSGLYLAEVVFTTLDSRIECDILIPDGCHVGPGDSIATLGGPAMSMLSGERLALNFLQRMSGIATMTARYVEAIAHTQARIVDTRKTAPGLRLLDKYAVICGGGYNHRSGLDDGILIKDNHIAAAGGITQALEQVQGHAPQGMRVEIEVDSFEQIPEALDGGVDIILLDNMSPHQMAEAVRLIHGRAKTEASGGISLELLKVIAETGVDYISVGKLTHSSPALDIGLDLSV